MNIKNLILFLIIASLCNCKSKDAATENNTTAEATNPTTPPDFEVFYEKFGKDTAFQMSHIIFPLEGRPAMKDGMDNIDPNFKWQKKDWIKHRAFDDMDGTFSRGFMNFAGIITEEVADNSGNFTMIRRFAKISDQWHLIYYKEMGR